ncbi:MAG TPA: 50S ribosomal protein L29 [Agitococcus sp.]|jgi:large subunit ribosomal protein L29|nr:50S ribosomal protein L29 [Moraxellaceae bacterium]MBK8326703.1 50S ribosomal protein L29 [Moraxellaceae bacterium]MBK9185500.1 50S ribosomal protein L29 [Moraxellaceae bacterium]MBL0230313.1 50S ribosomal protein L29 [Moraxellaceae bacterium]HQV79444.1 50S ribosomal protein L29 [Agitococcus sp.]
MKATELRQKTVEDLSTELDGLQLQQFKLRMAKATGQLAKTHQVGQVRKDIARIKTVLTEKQGG